MDGCNISIDHLVLNYKCFLDTFVKQEIAQSELNILPYLSQKSGAGLSYLHLNEGIVYVCMVVYE